MNNPFLLWWYAIFLFSASFFFVFSPWWGFACLVAGLTGGGIFWLALQGKRLKNTVPLSAEALSFSRYVADITHGDSLPEGRSTLVGREEELQVAEIVLTRPRQKGLLLVGDPGSGKSVFVSSLVKRFRERARKTLGRSSISFFVLDVKRALKEAVGSRTEKEHFLRALFEEIGKRGRSVILVEQGSVLSEEAFPVSRIFSEYASRPNLSLLVTLRPKEYEKAILSHSVNEEFETLFLRAPDKQETLKIMAEHFRPLEDKEPLFTLEGKKAWQEAVERLGDEARGMLRHEKMIQFGEELILFWSETGKGRITQETVEAFLQKKYPYQFRGRDHISVGLRKEFSSPEMSRVTSLNRSSL